MIDQHTLSVDVYYEEFGIVPPGFDTSSPVSQIPWSTEYHIPDSCIAGFIRDCQEARDEINTCLRDKCWAQVDTLSVNTIGNYASHEVMKILNCISIV